MEKHDAQTAFLDAENIRELYQQIMSKGYVGDNLTQQIIEDAFPDIVEPEIQREIDLEPGR